MNYWIKGILNTTLEYQASNLHTADTVYAVVYLNWASYVCNWLFMLQT